MTKPIPEPSVISKPYWDASQEGRYILQYCESCKRYNSYPREWCMHCWSTNLTFREASGKGEVVTYSIVHQPPSPSWETPYVLAVVRLIEGPQVMSNIINCELNKVKVGAHVHVCFEDREGFKIPQFTLTEEE